MEKEDIYKCFDSVELSDNQKSRMLNNILNESIESSGRKQKRPLKTKLIIATAIMILMTTAVIGNKLPTFLQLQDKINPDIAGYMELIEKTSVNQGIQVEVVAVGRYDNMIKAYITIEDLISNRIGKDLTFFDHISLYGNTKGKSHGISSSVIDYDKVSKKAALFVEAESSEEFKGENLIFKIGNMFYDSKEYDDYEIGVDLTRLNHDTPHMNAKKRQFMAWSGDIPGGKTIPILEPHVKDITFPEMKSYMVSNIGIIDGKLHVQKWRDGTSESDSLNIYLNDSNGERLDYDSSFHFKINKSGKPTSKPGENPVYTEYIFDIDMDRLDEYTLLSDYSTSKQLTGDWKVTFKAEDGGKLLEIPCQIDLDGIKIEKLKVNPFGVSLIGKSDKDIDFTELDIDIKIKTEDKEVKALFSSGSQNKNKFNYLYEMEKPIDLDTVKSIIINGEEILIK